jgi:hypothetical protein
MIIIGNIIVEESLLQNTFCCHLQKCLGACCVEGESGAPLSEEELVLLEKNYPKLKEYLPSKNKKVLEQNGLYVKDSDGDWTTTLTHSSGPCAYAIFENNIAFCAIEKAFNDKKINWRKPASCYLYPIRVEYKNGFTYLRYHQWKICRPALTYKKIPIFQFLKEPLIQYFGDEFYNQLEAIYKEKYQKK